ncbi:MAG TPA: DUF72 domain-containing protein, partial [Thermoanaerobaculia bacterium]
MDEGSQLSLFSTAALGKPARPGPFAERLQKEIAECAAIAERLPQNVRFGTSSWSFPGWAGIVYSRRASASDLAKTGLIEYARHPLLGTVG